MARCQVQFLTPIIGLLKALRCISKDKLDMKIDLPKP